MGLNGTPKGMILFYGIKKEEETLMEVVKMFSKFHKEECVYRHDLFVGKQKMKMDEIALKYEYLK